MRTASRLLIASIATLSLAGTAFAQDAEPAGDASGDASAEPAATTADPAAVTADGDAAAMGRWPRAIIDRPLTLPKGLGQVGADISTSTSNFFDPAVIRIGVGYGITDEFEINLASYTAPTDDFGKGALDINLGYSLVRGGAGGKLDLTGRAQLGYLLQEDASGDAFGVLPLALGVDVRYKVTPKIAIRSGAPSGTNFPGGLGSPSPQLQINLQDPHVVTLGLPVGVQFQATPELAVGVDTLLANLVVSDADTGLESTFIFGDSTPLSISGTYNAMPALDVYAALSLDVTPPDGTDLGDTVALGVGARYYFGKL